MKTPIAAAVASLFLASMGTVAFAQGAQQTTPQQTPPSQYMNNNQSTMNNNMSSRQMAHKIKQALMSQNVTATKVHVMFKNGTATLSGTVATQQDINKAKMAAMNVQGVKHVNVSGLHVGQV